MGPLAAWGVFEGDRSSVWEAVIVCLFPGGPVRGHPSCSKASLEAGVSAFGAEEISRGITAHQSARSIAKVLGRSPSTVSREISRNGGYDRYRAAQADESAWMRARRPKRCKLANNPGLRQAVMRKLRLNWAPEQISGWLRRADPEDENIRCRTETIYRSL